MPALYSTSVLLEFPRSVNVLLKRIGAHRADGNQLISYLLFSGSFCQELVELGYRDGMASQIRLREFLGAPEEEMCKTRNVRL
jgi:NTE family protein